MKDLAIPVDGTVDHWGHLTKFDTALELLDIDIIEIQTFDFSLHICPFDHMTYATTLFVTSRHLLYSRDASPPPILLARLPALLIYAINIVSICYSDVRARSSAVRERDHLTKVDATFAFPDVAFTLGL
jgi:hypothetical protein